MLENHQTDHDLRGHGDFRIAFHSHDIVIIIVTQICYSSCLLFLSVRRCTTSIKEAHFPLTFSWLVCPLISLTLFVSPRQRQREKPVCFCPRLLSFLSLPFPVKNHPASITHVPLLYFTHLSSLLKSMWLSVRQSVFHWSNPHLKEGWHVIVADSWSGL